MTSSAKSLEKVITAHPHPYQIILFLVCSPAFQFIHHSISTSVPPSYSITFLPSYVPVQLTLHVWVYMHLSLGVSSQLTYLLPPKWSLLFQPLANRFTHINFQLSRTSIFFSGSALYPMWSQCRKAPLLLFILLQWVEVLSDTWGAWHTHSLYKESLIPSSQTHTCTCEHTHTQDLLSRLGWIPGCVGHARSSVNAEAQPAWWKVQKGERMEADWTASIRAPFSSIQPIRWLELSLYSALWLTHLPSLSEAFWISRECHGIQKVLFPQTGVHFNCKTVYNCRNDTSYFISWIYNDNDAFTV